jgi:hypothetical protein
MLNAIATRLDAFSGTSETARCLDGFHLAIREGRHDDARRMALRQPSLVHMRDAMGHTALHRAALGDFEHPAQREPGRRLAAEPGCYVVIAARLLELGADPDVRNDSEQTPLHLAVERARDVALTRLLLERGADPMAIDAHGDTALHLAVCEPRHALELATLVRQCAVPGALRARNDQGQTPYDIANALPASTARDALLAALRIPTVPGNAVAPPSETPSPPSDPPWAIAIRMVRVALAQAASGPERPRINAIFSILLPLVTGLPDIAAREDAAQILTALLGHLGDLIAHCGADDVVPAMNLLRRMREEVPGLLEKQPLAWRLYLGYAELWRRARRWPEAVAYAGHAHGLAAKHRDSAAAAQIDAALDGIELAALQHHFQHWAAAVLADYQSALHDMETKWRDTDDLIEAMQCAAAQLRSIERARGSLLQHGARQLAQGFAELAHYMAVPALDNRIADALSVARQKGDKAVAFRALAAAILAFARETARHGLAGYGAAWCTAVANAVADRSSAAAVREYACGPHLDAAEALQLVEPPSHADPGPRPDREPPPVPAPPGNWRAFRHVLAALRQRVADAFAALPALPAATHPTLSDWQVPLPIEALQQRVTTDLTLLIGSIIEACTGPMLVQPPLAFAVLGLGSMSRADMGPYSDLEYAVVVAHPLQPETLPCAWFQQWRARFEFAVFSLGESSPGGDHPLTASRGLYLDCGPAAITAQDVLMETPNTLANRLRERNQANRKDPCHTDQDVAFSLLTPCLAYGSEALARDYAAALTRVLDVRQSRPGAFPYTARHDMALRQLHADVRHLGAAHQSNPATLHLKKQFAGPLNHALTMLALLYGYAARRPREILAQLAVSRRFAPAFLADYRWALATVQTIRLRTHLQHACHHDELAWDALMPDDAAALRAIEVRVVRPLWRAIGHWLHYHDYPRKAPSALLEYLHGLGDCDPALLAFEPAREPDAGGAGDRGPGVTPEAVESLVATLVHRQIDAAALTHYYCRAMARTARSQYEPAWTIWREGLKAREDAAALIDTLAALPCGDGWRGMWGEAQRAFHRHVDSWLADVSEVAAHGPAFAIQLPDMNRDPHGPAAIRRHVLRTDIATQVFHPDGSILPKPTGQRGRHTLLPVRFEADGKRLTYWIKIAPENAPLETLVHALDRRVSGGSGTPCSMICKLETRHGSVAALVMEGVGQAPEDLDTLLRRTPSSLRALDVASFTRALLRVMLTSPEDDKADDYFVRPDANGHLHLRRVDNERAFFAPEERRLLSANRLQVKSQLYCLDHMHAPLDPAVLRDFCQLWPVRMVQSWLMEAHVIHGHYRTLFTDEEVHAHFANGDMPCLLAVGIAEGLEQELVKRIDSIQGGIRLGQRDGTAVSGMTLLNMVQRELAKHYERAFRAFPVDTHRPGAAIERFSMLTEPSYSVNAHGERRSEMSGINAVSRSLNLSTKLRRRDVQAMAEGRFLSPAQALLRLQALEARRVHDIVAGVLVGKRTDRLRFATLPVRHRAEALAAVHAGLLNNPAAYTPHAQKRMLRAVAGVPFQELVLTGFAAVLTDDLLVPILRGAGESLRSVDLSGCWQVTQDSMVALAEQCGQLRGLRMRALNPPGGSTPAPLKALRKPLLSLGVLRLPQLRRLDAGDCHHLGDIRIDAPRLATLAIDGCTELLGVQTGSPALTTLDARNCAGLSEAALAAVTPAWSGMQSVQLQDCVRLQHIAFRQRYPWIADRPWNTWTSTQMARWEASLDAALAASREQAGVLSRERLRTWLDTRQMAVREMSDAVARATTLRVRFALMRALDTDGDGNDDEAGLGADQHRGQGDQPQGPDAAAAHDDPWASQSLRAIPNAHVRIHLTRLQSDDWQIRMAAAKRLGKAGASAPGSAIDALLTALRDREEAVVVAAATALSRIAIWPSSDALIALLQPQDASSTHPWAGV